MYVHTYRGCGYGPELLFQRLFRSVTTPFIKFTEGVVTEQNNCVNATEILISLPFEQSVRKSVRSCAVDGAICKCLLISLNVISIPILLQTTLHPISLEYPVRLPGSADL